MEYWSPSSLALPPAPVPARKDRTRLVGVAGLLLLGLAVVLRPPAALLHPHLFYLPLLGGLAVTVSVVYNAQMTYHGLRSSGPSSTQSQPEERGSEACGTVSSVD